MAAVPVTITGMLYHKAKDGSGPAEEPVTIIGYASITGLGIGGGPIIPPPVAPDVGHPSHPIALPGDPWWGADLHPEHPIVLPPEGEKPPEAPLFEWKTAWTPNNGWVLVGVPQFPHPVPSGTAPKK